MTSPTEAPEELTDAQLGIRHKAMVYMRFIRLRKPYKVQTRWPTSSAVRFDGLRWSFFPQGEGDAG